MSVPEEKNPFDLLPDELLLFIFDQLSENSDLLACCKVCKKWLGIIGNRTPLTINQQVFDIINSSTHVLYRNPKEIKLNRVQFLNVSDDFAQVLKNCEKVTIEFCKFKTAQALKSILLSCKNLKFLKIDISTFEKGIIETILNSEDELEQTSKHAEIGQFSLSFLDYQATYQLIKTFKALGIQLNAIGLGISTEDFNMELIEYVKENYGTKFKHLDFNPSMDKPIVDEFFRFITDWTELQLESFIYHGPSQYGVIDRFLATQTTLKKLVSVDAVNIDNCPLSLQHLNLTIDDISSARTAIDKLGRLKNLRHLFLDFPSAGEKKLNLSVINQMDQLEDVCIYVDSGWNEEKIELELTEPGSPLKNMLRLLLSNTAVDNDTMQIIMKNMPNIKCLRLLKTDGITAEALVTDEGQSIENLKNLRRLELPASAITDEVINAMMLPNLRELCFFKHKYLQASDNAITVDLAQNCPLLKQIKGSLNAVRYERCYETNKFYRVFDSDVTISTAIDNEGLAYMLDLDNIDDIDDDYDDYDNDDFDNDAYESYDDEDCG